MVWRAGFVILERHSHSAIDVQRHIGCAREHTDCLQPKHSMSDSSVSTPSWIWARPNKSMSQHLAEHKLPAAITQHVRRQDQAQDQT